VNERQHLAGAPFADRLEVAVNGGNAAAALGLGRGAVVQLRRGA